VTVDCTVTVGALWQWVHSDSGCTVTVGSQWLWVHSDCGCTVTVGYTQAARGKGVYVQIQIMTWGRLRVT